MSGIISIDAFSTPAVMGMRMPMRIHEVEMIALMKGCLLLLDVLGKVSESVEVIKIRAVRDYAGLNTFRVKVIIAVLSEEIKAEASSVIKDAWSYRRGSKENPHWNPSRLAEGIVEVMEPLIYGAIKDRLRTLGITVSRWEQLLPNP